MLLDISALLPFDVSVIIRVWIHDQPDNIAPVRERKDQQSQARQQPPRVKSENLLLHFH